MVADELSIAKKLEACEATVRAGSVVAETGNRLVRASAIAGTKLFVKALRGAFVLRNIKVAFRTWWAWTTTKGATEREAHAQHTLEEGFALIETNKMELRKKRELLDEREKSECERWRAVEKAMTEKETEIAELIRLAQEGEEAIRIELASVKDESDSLGAQKATLLAREKVAQQLKAELDERQQIVSLREKSSTASMNDNLRKAKDLEGALFEVRRREQELGLAESILQKKFEELQRGETSIKTREDALLEAKVSVRSREKQVEDDRLALEASERDVRRRERNIVDRESGCAELEESLAERERSIVESIGLTEESVENARAVLAKKARELAEKESDIRRDQEGIEADRAELSMARRQLDVASEALVRDRASVEKEREFVLKLRSQVGGEVERVQAFGLEHEARKKEVVRREAAIVERTAKLEKVADDIAKKDNMLGNQERSNRSELERIQAALEGLKRKEEDLGLRDQVVGNKERSVSVREAHIKKREEDCDLKEGSLKALQRALDKKEAELRLSILDADIAVGDRSEAARNRGGGGA